MSFIKSFTFLTILVDVLIAKDRNFECVEVKLEKPRHRIEITNLLALIHVVKDIDRNASSFMTVSSHILVCENPWLERLRCCEDVAIS
jgi:hypothetical protein